MKHKRILLAFIFATLVAAVDRAYAARFAAQPGAAAHGVFLQSEPPAKRVPRLQFRLVALQDDKSDADEMTDPSSGGRKLRVLKPILLDETDVELAKSVPEDADGSFAVNIQFTESGAEKMKKTTGENLGRTLAIVLDGKLLSSPVIQCRIGKNAIFNFGARGYTRDKVDKIIKAINDARVAADGKDR